MNSNQELMQTERTLQSAVVVGFFSLPASSLAEQNPDAYNAAMAAAPAGAGSCGHCGTGIRHHVIVRYADGSRGLIGTTCAERIGSERIQRCVRERLTEEQMAERERRNAERRAADDDLRARVAAERAARHAIFKDIIDSLRAQNSDFYSSLADQLVDGPLSDRQACYAVKAVIGRESKKNSEQWWALYERCTKADEL